jgi:hypothetical protein
MPGVNHRKDLNARGFCGCPDHGRPLSNRDKQHAFARYINLGLHLNGEDAVKPLRQIARECPVYDFRTIGRKLNELGIRAPREDVKPYRLDDTKGWEPSEDELALEQLSALTTFRQRLAEAMSSYALLDEAMRAQAFNELNTVVRSLESPLAI